MINELLSGGCYVSIGGFNGIETSHASVLH